MADQSLHEVCQQIKDVCTKPGGRLPIEVTTWKKKTPAIAVDTWGTWPDVFIEMVVDESKMADNFNHYTRKDANGHYILTVRPLVNNPHWGDVQIVTEVV